MDREEFNEIAEEDGMKEVIKTFAKEEFKNDTPTGVGCIALLFIWTYLFLGLNWVAYTLPIAIFLLNIVRNKMIKIAQEG